MSTGAASGGFVPPPYPQERVDDLRAEAARLDGGVVDLSAGIPCDPPPPGVAEVLAAAATVDLARPYPPSIGTPRLREAAAAWIARRWGMEVPSAQIAACIGTKELVAGLPHWLRLRTPARDTVLYPAVAYPTYEMGAILGGCRAVPVPLDDHWRIDLGAIDPADAARALCLWVNTPGNPAGGLDDLAAAAEWGRRHGVPVLSDECYAEFTWDGPPHTILEHGFDGVLAVHSVSKRSNLAGLRVGFYAGDAELVVYLRELRKHAGFMVPGPAQAAAAAALDDDAHVAVQRERYRERLEYGQKILAALGVDCPLPAGGFYLWAPAPGGDDWAFTARLARDSGAIVSPGELFGAAGRGWVRVALVQPMERLQLVARRLGVA